MVLDMQLRRASEMVAEAVQQGPRLGWTEGLAAGLRSGSGSGWSSAMLLMSSDSDMSCRSELGREGCWSMRVLQEE